MTSRGMDRPRRSMLMGVPISMVRLGKAMAWIAAWAPSTKARMVCTVNSEFVMRARHDEEFKCALKRSDMNVPDGMGVVVAGKLAGLPIAERVAGVDLAQAIFDQGRYRGWRLFLLGGAKGVADAAASRLTESHPGLQIVGCSSASSDKRFDEATVAEVNAAKPHILLVAFGAPVQELWIQRNLANLQCGVAVGVGGTLDYISGRATRAPKFVGAMGLEWAFRLSRDPGRWRRMTVLPGFAMLVLFDALRRSFRIKHTS